MAMDSRGVPLNDQTCIFLLPHYERDHTSPLAGEAGERSEPGPISETVSATVGRGRVRECLASDSGDAEA